MTNGDRSQAPGQEVEPSLSNEPADETPPRRFQFQISSLLLLTAGVAIVVAVVRPLFLSPLMQFCLALYAILLIAYMVFRGSVLLRRASQRRRGVKQRRRDLEAWVQQQRTASNDQENP